MSRSLRFRLLIGATLGSVVVLSLLGVSLYIAMQRALMRDFNASLITAARDLAAMTDQDEGQTTFEFDPQQMPEYLSAHSGRYFQLWLSDGKVLARSASLEGHDLTRIDPTGDAPVRVLLPDNHHGWAVAMNFTPRAEEHDGESAPKGMTRTASIVVVGRASDVEHTLQLLAWLLTTFCAAAVCVLAFILLRVVRRGVQPVLQVARDIDSLGETDLSRRLGQQDVPAELAPVIDKLNGLLRRLEQAFSREKAFTADVAHELRTPLAGLRTTLEVCRTRPREPAAYEAALDDCRGICDRMEAMVESLLLLARSETGQVVVARRTIQLSALVSQSWSLFEHHAQSRGLQTTFDLERECTVESDPEKLRIVLQNLMDNAVSHANEGGKIRISVHRNGHGAVTEVANTGSKISEQEVPRVFERFWRGDAARSDAGVHYGLGLSLCQRLTTLLGGEISISTVQGGEFIARVRLP